MSERLSREDWLRAALVALATHGHTALKADPLARSLGVSRGSFYWHFTDLAAFHAALLEHWRTRYSEAVIDALGEQPSPGAKLRGLLERTLASDSSLEAALRAWAIADPLTREVVDEVDRVRLAYVEGLLREHGVRARDIPARARLAYWAYLGQTMLSERPSRALRDQATSALVAMALQTTP